MELLKVENLTKKFKKKGILFPAVSQVSFTLEKESAWELWERVAAAKARQRI